MTVHVIVLVFSFGLNIQSNLKHTTNTDIYEVLILQFMVIAWKKV